MLNVIIGNVELAMDKVSPKAPIQQELKQIHEAAGRSVDITRQLLAFARRQTISPQALDLNEAIENMLKMLQRLIGENIHLAWHPSKDVRPVWMDPSQLDQILANLCVNARDAIADVGKITIETGTKIFDEAYCAQNAGFIPGRFSMLAVSDNGCGMDKNTLSQLFEPFFTTKRPGQGTGLGLATVYGIVKQNNGFIKVYSEPGSGTTFRIYLSAHSDVAEPIALKNAVHTPVGNGETVLIVEDEKAISNLIVKILEQLGYCALEAGTPARAMELADANPDSVDLLITDVVMPEMNGRDLANHLKACHPGIKVLFMSGYTANVIAHHGVLEKDIYFIQKPFSKQELAVKIREVLES
jgi:two-component system sensor histidine kinase EvgS